MPTIEQLNQAIDKAGFTWPTFAKAIEVDPKDLHRFRMAAKKKMTPERAAVVKEYIKALKKLKPPAKSLTAEIRKEIDERIKLAFGSVDKLCVLHGLNRTSVYQIINGQRTSTEGPVVKKLFNLLKMK